MTVSLRITEIFHSLQGETRTVGCPTVFVRLTGCPLRCQYCDTAYAFSGGVTTDLNEILDQVAQFDAKFVTVTGGEPLAQAGCIDLLSALCDAGYEVSIETSGALDISKVDPRVIKVMDIKTPGSLEVTRHLNSNYNYLASHDQVKFVICNREDYDWSKDRVKELNLTDKVSDVLFSPSNEELEASVLAGWILADKLRVRFQLQLHKYLWNNEPGH